MSRRPVLEEVGDDDIDVDMDIAQFDPSLRTPIAPLRPEPSVVRSQDSSASGSAAGAGANSLSAGASTGASTGTGAGGASEPDDIRDPKLFSDEEKRKFKLYQTVYPCYFDKSRSHRQGRRVSTENAVANPLAKTIADACRFLRIPVLLELDKTHPQDFGNPGRVKVLIKENGAQLDEFIKNKRQILNAIGKYMKNHPTTLNSISSASGHPVPEEYKEGFVAEELPVVKGLKMNTIVPVHSPYTLKHPMTKGIYDPEPEAAPAPVAPKAPKKKIMKIRG